MTIEPLSVSITPQEIWVQPGASAQIQIGLARGPGGDGDAVVALEDEAGANVSADPLTISAGNTTGTLTVHVAAAFAQGSDTTTIDVASGTADAQATLTVHVAGASGAPDESFAGSGVADLPPSSGQDVGAALIALQSGVLVGGTHVETGDAGSVSTMKVFRLGSGGGVDGAFAVTFAPGELRSIAMLPDGRVFAVGDVRGAKADFAAVRMLAAGGLDPTYAVVTPITLGDDVARAAVVEPGGRLVAAGSVGDASAFGVARYTQAPLPLEAGTDAPSDAVSDSASDSAADAGPDAITSHLDPTFGEGGVVVTTLAKPNAGASSMLLGSDGSLYVLGFQADTTTDVALLHYDTSGALLQTTTVPLATGTYGAAAAILQPDGAIAVATDDGGQALILRVLPSGALDTSFGAGGKSALTIGASSASRALARDPSNGDLYVGGFSATRCFVARVSSAGALDTSFASSGILMLTQGDACDVAALAIDDDRKILVLETVTSGGATHMAVGRYWR
ncbi:MAG TPA: hypothetical protein VGH28_25660 [Polyangiaceae bacterium]